MIEESYVRLYATDFVRIAQTAEFKPLDPTVVPRRVDQARAHAMVMDAAKGDGHLAALVTRLRDEARRPVQASRIAEHDHLAAADRREKFLNTVADDLSRSI